MIMYHLGPQLGVWIMQVSTFSRVLINRFHCRCNGKMMEGFITLTLRFIKVFVVEQLLSRKLEDLR